MVKDVWTSSVVLPSDVIEAILMSQVKVAIKSIVEMMLFLMKQEQDVSSTGKLTATIDNMFFQEDLAVLTAQSTKEYSEMTHGYVNLWSVETGRDFFHQDNASNAHFTRRLEDSTVFKSIASQLSS